MNTLALVVPLAVGLGAHAQNLVVNGSFESPVVNGAWVQRFPGTTFDGWTVDNDGQGIVQVAGFGNPNAIDGQQCVELNFYVQGGISQVIPTTPGSSYLITFLLAGQTNAGPDVKDMNVDWNGSTLATVSWNRSTSGGAWQAHQLVATATAGATLLHFRGLQNVDGGPYLDAVSVVTICSADFNNDGFTDIFDFSDFVTCFEGGNCPAGRSADFNNDGFADIYDFNDFVDAFESGC